MKQIFLILMFLFGLALAQIESVSYQRVPRTGGGKVIPGLDVDLYYGGTSNKAYDLTEVSSAPGKYNNSSVEPGIYDVWINGSLNESSIVVGTVADSTLTLVKMTKATIDYIGSGGSVTNNPDDITLEAKPGDKIGIITAYLDTITSNMNWVSLQLKGGIPDDATSANTALTNAISDANSDYNGGSVFIQGGKYYVPGAITQTTDVKLFGDPSGASHFRGNSTYFMRLNTDTVIIQNQRFSDYANVFEIKGNIKYLEISNCTFDNNTSPLDNPDDANDYKIETLVLKDNIVKNCNTGFMVDTDSLQNAWALNNLIYNLSSTNATIGIMFGRDDSSKNYNRNYIIAGNVIDSVLQTDATAHETHGIYVFGDNVVIDGNVVNNIEASNSAVTTAVEGIYAKLQYGSISNNMSEDGGFYEGVIAVKGRPVEDIDYRSLGWNIIVANNNLINTDTYHQGAGHPTESVGINIQTRDVLVVNNYLDGFTDDAIYAPQSSNPWDNVTIRGNHIVNTKGAEAIRFANSGRNLTIENNLIFRIISSSASANRIYGMDIGRLDEELDDVIIRNNTILVDSTEATSDNFPRGIRLLARDYEMNNVIIDGNIFDFKSANVTTSTAIEFYGYATDHVFDSVIVKNNDFRYVDALFAENGEQLQYITSYDNLSYDVQAMFDLMEGKGIFTTVKDTFIAAVNSLDISYPGYYNFNGAVINVDTLTFLPKGNSNSNVIEIRSDDVTIANLTILGNYDVTRGIYLTSGYGNITIRDVKLIGTGQGIRMDDSHNVLIDNATVWDSTVSTDGVYGSSSAGDSVTVTNCNLYAERGIYFKSNFSDGSKGAYDLIISNNRVVYPTGLGTHSEGITASYAVRAKIINNFIDGFDLGISMTGDTLYNGGHLVSGNTVNGRTNSIEFVRVRNGKVANNFFYADSGVANFSNCKNLTIIGNTFRGDYYNDAHMSRFSAVGLIYMLGYADGDGYVDPDSSVDNTLIMGNKLSNGGDGIRWLSSLVPTSHIQINNNQFDSLRQAIYIGSSGSMQQGYIQVNNNVAKNIHASFFVAADSITSLQVNFNMVQFDSSQKQEAPPLNWGMRLVGVDDLQMIGNFWECINGGLNRPVTTQTNEHRNIIHLGNIYKDFINNTPTWVNTTTVYDTLNIMYDF